MHKILFIESTICDCSAGIVKHEFGPRQNSVLIAVKIREP